MPPRLACSRKSVAGPLWQEYGHRVNSPSLPAPRQAVSLGRLPHGSSALRNRGSVQPRLRSCAGSLALALAALVSLPGQVSSQAAGSPRLLTSILPIYCLTRLVAGNAVLVENLIAPNTDAHDFQLTRRERTLLDKADVLLVNGLGMEPWLEATLERGGFTRNVVRVAAGLDDPSLGLSGPNPHVWLDPVLACGMVTNIVRALQTADPSRGATYSSNAAIVVARLQSFHAEQLALLAPFTGVAFMTHHDAFAYFARRYGLKVVGVIEEVPEVPPSLRHLSALRETARRQAVKAIFIQPGHAGKQARQLGADLGIPVAELDSLETGPARPEAYEEGLRRNLRTLRERLK